MLPKGSMLAAMRETLGDSCLDPATLQALEVSQMMAAAGASQEEIEEMMAMILNKEGAVSPDFIKSIKEVMQQAAASGTDTPNIERDC